MTKYIILTITLIVFGLVVAVDTIAQDTEGDSGSCGEPEEEVSKIHPWLPAISYAVRFSEKSNVLYACLRIPDERKSYGQTVSLIKGKNGFWVCECKIWTGNYDGKLWFKRTHEGVDRWFWTSVDLKKRSIEISNDTIDKSERMGSPTGTVYYTYQQFGKNTVKVEDKTGWVLGGLSVGNMTDIGNGEWLGVGTVYGEYEEGKALSAYFTEYKKDGDGNTVAGEELKVETVTIVGYIPNTGN